MVRSEGKDSILLYFHLFKRAKNPTLYHSFVPFQSVILYPTHHALVAEYPQNLFPLNMSKGGSPQRQILEIEMVLMGMGYEEVFDAGKENPIAYGVHIGIGREVYEQIVIYQGG